MPIFRVDVPIYATAYIRARDETSALKKAKKLALLSPNIGDSGGSVPISGLAYDDPNLPEVSLSPAMTIHEIDADAVAEIAE